MNKIKMKLNNDGNLMRLIYLQETSCLAEQNWGAFVLKIGHKGSFPIYCHARCTTVETRFIKRVVLRDILKGKHMTEIIFHKVREG